FSISNLGASFVGGTTFAAYHPDWIATPNSDKTVWTITFTGDGVNTNTHSIGDGKYRLTLNNDANSLHSTYDFYRLLGDMSDTASDGTTDSQDLQTFIGTFLKPTTDPSYLGADDFDGGYSGGANTGISGQDLQLLIGNFLHTVGDVSGFH